MRLRQDDVTKILSLGVAIQIAKQAGWIEDEE